METYGKTWGVNPIWIAAELRFNPVTPKMSGHTAAPFWPTAESEMVACEDSATQVILGLPKSVVAGGTTGAVAVHLLTARAARTSPIGAFPSIAMVPLAAISKPFSVPTDGSTLRIAVSVKAVTVVLTRGIGGSLSSAGITAVILRRPLEVYDA